LNIQRKFIVMLICITMIMTSCAKTPMTPAEISNEEWIMIGNYADSNPSKISRELELKSFKNYDDFVDLGTSYLLIGEYLKAAEAYELSARQAKTTSQLVGSLYNKAAALAYVDLNKAISSIELATRLQPSNLEVAWLRYALYRYSGDNLGIVIAGDHLITLDPSLAGKGILTGMEAAVIITLAVIISGTTITAIALTPPEDRKEVVISIMPDYFKMTGKVIIGSLYKTASFGQYLMEQAK
jgi:tetratricopeptide (TPR) repeat protein